MSGLSTLNLIPCRFLFFKIKPLVIWTLSRRLKSPLSLLLSAPFGICRNRFAFWWDFSTIPCGAKNKRARKSTSLPLCGRSFYKILYLESRTAILKMTGLREYDHSSYFYFNRPIFFEFVCYIQLLTQLTRYEDWTFLAKKTSLVAFNEFKWKIGMEHLEIFWGETVSWILPAMYRINFESFSLPLKNNERFPYASSFFM